MTKPTSLKIPEWEKEFDKLGLIWFQSDGMDIVKDYIKDLLSAQRDQLIQAISELKDREIWVTEQENTVYDAAIYEVLSLIKEGEV